MFGSGFICNHSCDVVKMTDALTCKSRHRQVEKPFYFYIASTHHSCDSCYGDEFVCGATRHGSCWDGGNIVDFAVGLSLGLPFSRVDIVC